MKLIDPAAERGVLAGVCSYGADALADASDLLTANSFGLESNQIIWGCLAKVIADDPNGVVDLPSVLSAANSLGFGEMLQKQDELACLRAVFNLKPEAKNVRKLAGKVKKLEFARRVVSVLDGVRNKVEDFTGDENPDAMISAIQSPVLDIADQLDNSSERKPSFVGEGIRDYIRYLEDNPRQMVGLASGFRRWDLGIGGGLRPGSVNLMGARSGVGKSYWAVNLGLRLSSGAGYEWPKFNPMSAVQVLHLDTEMSKEEQADRQLSCLSGVPVSLIATGQHAADAVMKSKVRKAGIAMESLPYEFVNIAGQPYGETEALMRRWVTRRVGLNPDGSAKPCVIIFDYLKLMDSASMTASKLAEFQVLGFMMTQLHNFASKYRLPIVLFSQLNRDGIETEDASAVAGSDRVIWLCSNFTIFKLKNEEEHSASADKFSHKLVVCKSRHGAGMAFGDYINVNFQGKSALIEEGPTRSELMRSGSPKRNGIILGEDDDAAPVSL